MTKLDLSSVKPEPAAWQTSTTDNPAVVWLQASYDAQEARQVTVPASQARQVVNMLYGASRVTNLGVSIRIKVGNDEFATSTELWDAVEKLKDKNVTVKFRGKNKTNRPRKNVVAPADQSVAE